MAESEESIITICDDILINEVNNTDVKVKLDLNDLLTRIGPREDFLRSPDPVVVVTEVSFDMGYDDILINEVNNVDVLVEEDLDDLLTEIGLREDFQLAKVEKPKSEFPPGYAMSPNRPPPFKTDYDVFLINKANNIDVRIEEDLDDLFTEIGPTEDFQLPKEHKAKTEEEYPEGYAMSPDHPPPFDMGYDDILINETNNVNLINIENLDNLFTKIGRRKDFKPPPKKKVIKTETFDMGYKDILINEVNNRDVTEKEKLDDLYTKIGPRKDFLAKAVKPISKYPRGYAMSPDDPPPFDMGYDDILINETNNADDKIDVDLYDLLKKIGKRVDFKKKRCRTPKFRELFL